MMVRLFHDHHFNSFAHGHKLKRKASLASTTIAAWATPARGR
jgi:hypothetical protein